jgi:hypothetical protein
MQVEDRNKVSRHEAETIEIKTRGQNKNVQWKEERLWRVTASKFGEICKATERRDFGKMANSLLNPPTLTGDAIVHGQVHEASALKKFSEVTGKIVQATGKCLKRGLISHTLM